jgi:hypothetical protein
MNKIIGIISIASYLTVAATSANAQPLKLSDLFSSYQSISDTSRALLLDSINSAISSGADQLLGNARTTLGNDPLSLLQFDQIKSSLKNNIETSMGTLWNATLGTYTDLIAKESNFYGPDSATSPSLTGLPTPVTYTLTPIFKLGSVGNLTRDVLSGNMDAVLGDILLGAKFGIDGNIHFGGENGADLGVALTDVYGSNLFTINSHIRWDGKVNGTTGSGKSYTITWGMSASATLSSDSQYKPEYTAGVGLVCTFDPDCRYTSIIDEPGVLSLISAWSIAFFAFYLFGPLRVKRSRWVSSGL